MKKKIISRTINKETEVKIPENAIKITEDYPYRKNYFRANKEYITTEELEKNILFTRAHMFKIIINRLVSLPNIPNDISIDRNGLSEKDFDRYATVGDMIGSMYPHMVEDIVTDEDSSDVLSDFIYDILYTEGFLDKCDSDIFEDKEEFYDIDDANNIEDDEEFDNIMRNIEDNNENNLDSDIIDKLHNIPVEEPDDFDKELINAMEADYISDFLFLVNVLKEMIIVEDTNIAVKTKVIADNIEEILEIINSVEFENDCECGVNCVGHSCECNCDMCDCNCIKCKKCTGPDSVENESTCDECDCDTGCNHCNTGCVDDSEVNSSYICNENTECAHCNLNPDNNVFIEDCADIINNLNNYVKTTDYSKLSDAIKIASKYEVTEVTE